eukprot:jgi/Mesen1/3961/ME000021S03484
MSSRLNHHQLVEPAPRMSQSPSCIEDSQKACMKGAYPESKRSNSTEKIVKRHFELWCVHLTADSPAIKESPSTTKLPRQNSFTFDVEQVTWTSLTDIPATEASKRTGAGRLAVSRPSNLSVEDTFSIKPPSGTSTASRIAGESGSVGLSPVWDAKTETAVTPQSAPNSDTSPPSTPIILGRHHKRSLSGTAGDWRLLTPPISPKLASDLDSGLGDIKVPTSFRMAEHVGLRDFPAPGANIPYGEDEVPAVLPEDPPSVPITVEATQQSWYQGREKRETTVAEVEIMKERFAKLLLGEDMSGGSKGVCQALAISNAITNLAASVFGERWKLTPLAAERKHVWRREMEWLLCVSDYIVELVPGVQKSSDGTLREVMLTKQRADLLSSLPALRKLDGMLLDTMDNFVDMEVTYTKPSDTPATPEKTASTRNQDKWWLPTPQVPKGGLSSKGRGNLVKSRETAQQILKAAMAINAQVLNEMDIPDSYADSLPKTGRASLGDGLYRELTGDVFSPDRLLERVDLSSEMAAVDTANKLETAINVWRRKVFSRNTPLRDPKAKKMGDRMRDIMGDSVKMEEYSQRAESALLLLRARCPGLSQTTLDSSKIQYNRDVGRAILESYSRVLESLASNIVSRTEDVLYEDDLAKNPDARSSKFHNQNFSPLFIPKINSDVHIGDLVRGDGHDPDSPPGDPGDSPTSVVTPTSPISLKSESSSTFSGSLRGIFGRRRPPGLPIPKPYRDTREELLARKFADQAGDSHHSRSSSIESGSNTPPKSGHEHTMSPLSKSPDLNQTAGAGGAEQAGSLTRRHSADANSLEAAATQAQEKLAAEAGRRMSMSAGTGSGSSRRHSNMMNMERSIPENSEAFLDDDDGVPFGGSPDHFPKRSTGSDDDEEEDEAADGHEA